jgi:hypothetical protein
VAPDDVVEDVAQVAALLERAEDGVHGSGADRVPALHELDELVDDGAGPAHVLLVALEGQPVPAQEHRATEPVAQPPQNAVVDGRELCGDLVGYRDDVLQPSQCRCGLAGRPSPLIHAPVSHSPGGLRPWTPAFDATWNIRACDARHVPEA